jgi:hypothetical protein
MCKETINGYKLETNLYKAINLALNECALYEGHSIKNWKILNFWNIGISNYGRNVYIPKRKCNL